MLLHVNTVTTENFGIVPTQVSTTLEIRMTGTGDGAAVSALRDCLTGVKLEMARGSLTELIFDVRTLYLLNSSCLKCIATFVFDLKSSGVTYPVRFVVNAKLPWQGRALIAIGRLAPTFVSIEQV